MRVLHDHPKKTSWRLERVTWPDGRTATLVGPQERYRYGEDWRLRHESMRGARVDLAPNAVIDAAIKVVGTITYRAAPMFLVAEREGNLGTLGGDGLGPMQIGAAAMADILMALGGGRLRLEDGWITGRFTFDKKSSDVRLVPFDGPAAGETVYGTADGAADLSDFVKTLGAPR